MASPKGNGLLDHKSRARDARVTQTQRGLGRVKPLVLYKTDVDKVWTSPFWPFF